MTLGAAMFLIAWGAVCFWAALFIGVFLTIAVVGLAVKKAVKTVAGGGKR